MIVATIARFLASNEIPGPLVVAVSGGPDSTALLLALPELREVKVVAAHVNHHLRGAESDGDEAFVRELCGRLGVELRVADGTLDPESVRHHGIEAAAREVRQARLQEIRSEVHASHIATAHQKNDQAETVLMRVMNGGGLAALRGIHPVRADGVIRPLLDVTRAEIESFLRERGVTPRIDRTNSDPRFLRNRVRMLLAEFDPRVIDNLASLATRAQLQWEIMERLLDDVDNSAQTPTETRFRMFPDDRWLRQALLYRHIRRLDPAARDVSAADLERLAGQLDTLKRVSVTRSLELLRRRDIWILRRRLRPVEPFEIEIQAGESAFIPQIAATIRIVPTARQPDKPTTQAIQLPSGSAAVFTVRNRRDGDRFQPLGMQQQKKLKDFLIDRKIAAEVRDRIPLLLWRGTIACVGGVEISETFKITSGGELYEIAIETTNQEGV